MGKRGFKPGKRRNNTSWVQVDKENSKWEAYYKELGLINDTEWDKFNSSCQSDLPLTFRITGTTKNAIEMRRAMKDKYIDHMKDLEWEGQPVEPPSSLPFYHDELAWQVKVGKQVIRKNKQFAKFQRFLVVETEVGNISRQEAVSMIPPLVLDVEPHHNVIDLCAAPGSKTAQLVEAIHTSKDGSNASPTGVVVANDSDYKRSHMLIHQVKRLNSPNFVVTNHDAQFFPKIKMQDGTHLKFDRVLCDVPCSGDGTMRKNINVWKDWTVGNGLGLHTTQINILARGVQLLKSGGRLVYSTCSLNPIENEAVVAEVLRQYKDLELVDVSDRLPGLIRSPGVSSWKVQTKDGIWRDFGDAGVARSLFPPDEEESKRFNLDRCIRVYPHQQDTGGFFITVFHKKGSGEQTKKREGEEQTEQQPEKKIKLDNEEARPQEIENTNGSSLEQPVKKPKLPRDANEESFVFLDPNHPTVELCWKFYNISSDFRRDCLMVRNASGEPVRTIYYVAPAIKEIIEQNESKLQFVHTGIKLFAQQKHDGDCKWRVQSEGLELLYPYVGQHRVVAATSQETLKYLCQVSFPKFDELESVDKELKEQVIKVDEGCLFLKVSMNDDIVVYPMWRGRGSVNIMLPKKDTQEVLHRVFGVENLKTDNKENGTPAEGTASETAELETESAIETTAEKD
jgi:multisite-specific tRNA:(cytosine-C5)-methyltransferase